ncbi:nipblb, partial [Symbiodinium necroappetens]
MARIRCCLERRDQTSCNLQLPGFNPNRRDDRLLDAEVTARRHPRPQKPAEDDDSDSEELINTEPEFVLSMESDSRVDWLQMALMQAAEGKLKAAALYEAMLTANLHLFSAKHKKVLEEAANSWGSEGSKSNKARRASSSDSSSSSSSSSSRKVSKKE